MIQIQKTCSKILTSFALVSLLVSTGIAKDESYLDEMKRFEEYKQNLQKQFEDYKKAQEKAFNEYKKELGKYWEDPKLTNKKEWISYTPDKKTRTDVDFKNNKIVVETITAFPKEAKQKLQKALARALVVDTKTAHDTDPLQKKLAKIKKPPSMVDAKVDPKPILAPVVFKKPPTKKDVVRYVKQKTNAVHVKKKSKQKGKNIYYVEVKLPNNTTVKRSKIYYPDAMKHSKKQKIPLSLIFAIMHSESSFNPMARSHIPAYGLMQIVPRTAGIDTYRYLYGQKKLVSSDFLYNSKNNIMMGSGYLHILYYRYLRDIKDPLSRTYCTIAAYNTGAGNIAYAFTRKYNVKRAAKIINKMSPDEVYAKLMKDLRFDEPKHYLKKVSKRMKMYKKIYGS